VNTVVVFFIRLLETLFVIGAIGCILAVIPVTAHRLLMVLFEPAHPGEELPPISTSDSQRHAA
jgi:hypothetical protein